jgi:hypothetical protein
MSDGDDGDTSSPLEWFDGVRSVDELREVLRQLGDPGDDDEDDDGVRPAAGRVGQLVRTLCDSHPRLLASAVDFARRGVLEPLSLRRRGTAEWAARVDRPLRPPGAAASPTSGAAAPPAGGSGSVLGDGADSPVVASLHRFERQLELQAAEQATLRAEMLEQQRVIASQRDELRELREHASPAQEALRFQEMFADPVFREFLEGGVPRHIVARMAAYTLAPSCIQQLVDSKVSNLPPQHMPFRSL